MVRFSTVGSAHTALDAALYFSLTRGLEFFERHFLYAAAVSFFVSAFSSFFWNKHWTFKHPFRFHHSQLIRFYTVGAIALLLNQLVLWQLVEWQLFDIAAKVLASMAAGLFNFAMQKFWAFAHRQHIVQRRESEYTTVKR